METDVCFRRSFPLPLFSLIFFSFFVANGNTAVQSNSKPTSIPEPQKLSSNTNTLNDKTIPASTSAPTAPISAGKAKNQRDSRNRRNGGGGGGANNKSLKTIPDQSQTHVNSNTDKQTVNGTA